MKEKVKVQIEQEIAEWFNEYKIATEKVSELKERRKLIEKKVETLMDDCGKGELSISQDTLGYMISCKRILNKKVEFIPENLEKNIDDKEVLSQIIDKTYTINDWKKFAKFLKSNGIKAKDIVKFIDVKKDVNNKQIEQLEQIGVITFNDIKGCYICKDMSSYIRFSYKRK